MQPRDTHPRAFAEAAGFRTQLFHRAHNLVPRDDRRLARRQLALDDVQIRAAHAAGVYPNQNFAARRPRNVYLDKLERVRSHRGRSLKHASLHCSSTIHFESVSGLADIKCLTIRMPWNAFDRTSMPFTTSGARRRVASLIALSCFLLHAFPATAQNASSLPQLSRATSAGQFVSAVGRRAALL